MDSHLIEIDKLLSQGRKLAVVRIIRQVGSAPRTVGTNCLILEDGTLMGTIGGGSLEFRVLEKTKECFRSGRSSLLRFKLTGKEVGDSEMLCGGIVDVYLEPVYPDNSVTREVFKKIKTAINDGRGGVLQTKVADGISHSDTACRAFWADNGQIEGALGAISKSLSEKLQLLSAIRKSQLVELKPGSEGPFVFVEPVKSDDTLYLFGAGHIATFIAPLAKMVGFRVVVIDDREEFVNRDRFPNADKLLNRPFADAIDNLSINSSSYIAIVTRGHVHDRVVLRDALQTSAAYIGMIGSRRKRDIVYRSLIKEGISKERIDPVHCPVGLDIGAETPEEIAVSIVAELVKVRSAIENST
jgi:xanthine dehydrogenase accessory factor